MAMNKTTVAKNTDAYIEQFPEDVQVLLQQLRNTIKAAAPQAEEVISYQMPAFKYHGVLVYFAAWKNHIGFYPASSVIHVLNNKLKDYLVSKGTIQFPLDAPLPLDLVADIVKLRVQENEEKIAIKKKSKQASSNTSISAEALMNTNKKKLKPQKLTDAEQINNWLDKLDPMAKEEINAIRNIIKKGSPKLSERIKWNAPSYHLNQVDILTFGPYKKDKILLVFHHPAVVKITSPLLEGNYKDRRLLYFKNKAEATKNKTELTRIILEILIQIETKPE
jgi:uncharacterized protein YdhG (YjbR/CyaY superfamily)